MGGGGGNMGDGSGKRVVEVENGLWSSIGGEKGRWLSKTDAGC